MAAVAVAVEVIELLVRAVLVSASACASRSFSSKSCALQKDISSSTDGDRLDAFKFLCCSSFCC